MNHPPTSDPLAMDRDPHGETTTRLHGRGLAWLRVLWIVLCGLSVWFFFAGVESYIAHDFTFCTGPAAACLKYGNVVVPPTAGPGLAHEALGIIIVIRATIFSLAYWLVAAFLFWR